MHFLYSFSSITASLNIHKYWTHTVQRKLTSRTAGQWQISFNNQWPQMLRNRNGLYLRFFTIYPSLKCCFYKTFLCVQNLEQDITFIFITKSKYFPGQDMCVCAKAHSWVHLCICLLYNTTVLGSKGNKSITVCFCRRVRDDWRMH